MTVTLPVHPLVGQALEVVHFARYSDGRRYVHLRHPAGHVIRLPLAYTSRATPAVVPRVGNRELRASVSGLVRLAAAVDAALGTAQKLDEQIVDGRSGKRSQPTTSDGARRSAEQRPDGGSSADSVAGREQSDPRRPGDAGPQGLVGRRPGRGGGT